MKLGAFVIGVILSLGCTTLSAHDASEYATAKAKYRMWNQLCMEYRTEVSCAGIKPPKIVREHMRQGLRGYYDGSDTIYINRTLHGSEREATIAHEMSHYLDTMLGMNPDMPVKRSDKEGILGLCMSEKRAWAVSDQFWKRYNRRIKPIGAKWVTWYDHCRQFADVLYPDVYAQPLPEQRYINRRARGLISN